MIKRLLVPLDGSPFGSRAIKYAIEIARRFSADILLLQVIKPATLVAGSTGMAPGIESPTTVEIAMKAALEDDKRNVARARRYLGGKIRGIKAQGIKGSYQVVVGEPSRAIMKFSRQEHIDLIVMTTHGKSGLRRAIMGSVTDAVIRESGKPVLVIRPPKRGEK